MGRRGRTTATWYGGGSALLLLGLVALAVAFGWGADPARAAPCDEPVLNPVACENSKPGTPPNQWDVSGAGNDNIQGFATDMSVDQGETEHFKIDTNSGNYRLEIFRMGYYDGDGARLVDTVQPSANLPQNQPDCIDEQSTGLIDCGNWQESASWQVPGDAVSGIYFAKLVREDGTPGESHVFFVVRDDDGNSDLLFQTSDTTWQAYNRYGGNSLYTGSPDGRAYKVSYNRPFTTRGPTSEDWVFNSEYPMVRWLESNGYDVSYFSGIDSDRRGSEILDHKVFLSVGHDEYWSGQQRSNVTAARDAGVNLAFFSGNEVFWKTRWESSIDGSGDPYRTLVSYKDTHANAAIDPTGEWTGTWRDNRSFNPEGEQPENALTGNIFTVNCCSYAMEVPAADGKMRFWRNTSVAGLSAGQTATLGDSTIGYEWDEDLDNGFRPPGTFRLSSTTVDADQRLQDQGTNYGPGQATHSMTMYRDDSGALVFGAGTIQWPWGLDSHHDRGGGAPDPAMQQATVNLLADMGTQPATLAAGLQQAAESTDSTAPSSTIQQPTAGSQLTIGQQTQISGTATDQGGGVVGGVEVSVDGGTTWHRATGRSSWTYSWTPGQAGQAQIKVRATDDSGNIESPGNGVTVTVANGGSDPCPCSIWNDSVTPPVETDPNAVELGVKFRSDEDGYITGLRYYKGAQNTGTHVGHLWSSSGTMLAEATFTNESNSGWQQVDLSPAVPVTAGTTYVASYLAPNGHYAATTGGLDSAVDTPPLHALADGADGGNGVYRYGSSGGFPTQTYRASNYWVDVVFATDTGADVTPPTVSSVDPAQGSATAGPNATVSATFSEKMDPATISGQTVKLRQGSQQITATVAYDAAARKATLTPSAPLQNSTTYTATISGGASGVADLAGNRLGSDFSWSFATRDSGSDPCPCSIWDDSVTPPVENDPNGVELGVKFRSDENGYITGLRYYKGTENTGVHVGHLWTASGTLLAQATFTGESSSGWQQVDLSPAVPVSAGTTYVASYYAPNGHYAATNNGFGSAVDTPPLHGLANGADGGNGVYRYGSSGGFPTQTYQASNYWVDVVFATDTGGDVTPPTVSSVDPAQGSTTAATSTKVSATFSEPMDPATISGQTVKLRQGSQQIAASVGYDSAGNRAVLTPDQALEHSTTYTATVSGGASGVADVAGNRLASDFSWSFTTGAAPPPDNGPGGPILVISNPGDPFSRYYAEILKAEGLNEFRIENLGSVDASTLSSYDVAILGATSLDSSQAQMLTTWVTGGGNLIAMRPAPQLSGLLGLTAATGTLSDAYLKVDTADPPGSGITDSTMQFHGTADRYTTSGATTVASLYSDASTATSAPAVTMRDVGSNGGQAAAFTYDLARSVVYTRQGNPDWAGEDRDGFAPIRSDDLFFGGAGPDWVDPDKVAIPQADEQQRLLANLIGELNADEKPLPRFWYFPRSEKAVVVMTGDDHAGGGTAARFGQFNAASPSGCSVADWECIRATSYLYPDSPLTPAQAASFESQGFEVAAHLSTGCSDYTPSSLADDFDAQIAEFRSRYSGVPAPSTNRTHCVVWSDWSSQAEAEAERGIRLDTNYYYWPQEWIQDRPGMFTGSGMPMRFAEEDGTVIDTYQAVTQMTDESGQSYPFTIDALLDRALGSDGYYGAFVANMHTDDDESSGADAIVASALARGVPVISARQLLQWTDGRNGSSFESIDWSGGDLSFSISPAAGANGLQAMVPTSSKAGDLSVVRRDGTPVATTTSTIKGVEYAFFTALPGDYTAAYAEVDTTPPAITGAAADAANDGTAEVTWATDEPADSRVDYGTTPSSLNATEQSAQRVTDHVLDLTGLTPGTTYYYRLRSADASGNATTYPAVGNAPLSFTTPPSVTTGAVSDTSTADFNSGQVGAGAYVAETTDGELALKPTVGEEFRGSVLPSGWSTNPWSSPGTASTSGGALRVDGASFGTNGVYGAGRSLEFVATFSDDRYQHAGLGVDYNATPAWAIFSTKGGGALYARTNNSGSQQETQLAAGLLGTPHRYRIDWSPTAVTYYVDGAQVASHATSFGSTQMRPLLSDYATGGGQLAVDWLRMTPNTTAGTFDSRVLDAGSVADWGTLSTVTTVPAGTSIVVSVRTGNTPTPDGTWSAWTTIGTSGPVGSSSRYLQYRADLQSTGTEVTPVLQSLTVDYTKPG